VENQTTNSQDRPRILETYGVILPGGVVLDLVMAASGDKVALLRWYEENYEIGPHFQVGSTFSAPLTCNPVCSGQPGLHASRRSMARLANCSGRWSIFSTTT
jgi:hypothetical protein